MRCPAWPAVAWGAVALVGDDEAEADRRVLVAFFALSGLAVIGG